MYIFYITRAVSLVLLMPPYSIRVYANCTEIGHPNHFADGA